MLRCLLATKNPCVILPLVDEDSRRLLPILKIVAAFTRARRIEVVQPSLDRSGVRRLLILRDSFSFLFASVANLWHAFRVRRMLTRLLAAERQHVAIKKLRSILYLNTNLWIGVKAGGSVGHIAGVVNGFVRDGLRVRYVSVEPPNLIDKRADFIRVNLPVGYGLPYELNNYRFQNVFVKQLLQNGSFSDVSFIYQRLCRANFLGALLSRKLRTPLVVEYNGSEVWIARNWGMPMSFEKLALMAEDVMLRHAHVVVTVSEVLRDELISRGVESERIVTYPNCIDEEVFSPDRFSTEQCHELRLRYGISPDATVVTFIGTFGQWHGIEVLARAIAELVATSKEWLERYHVRFLLIGDGLKMPIVREILTNGNAMPYCVLTGLVAQHEAPLHLAASDIFVSPHVANADGSRFFGSPTKLFEYLAMRRAVVASDLDQIGEVLSNSIKAACPETIEEARGHGRVAVLIPPGDHLALIKGICLLVENPGLREVLARNAQLLAHKKYLWKHHVSEILKGLEKVQESEHGAAKQGIKDLK